MRAGEHQCFAYAVGGFDGSHYRDTVYYAPFQPAPPCAPVSSVQLSRMPDGDLFIGTTVRFTASAEGTTPFTYKWSLNGNTVGGNLSTYEHTFTTAGTFPVGVTVTNACGQSNALMNVPVQQRPLDLPDLSLSSKAVNRFNVDRGDILTYTLILRNSSSITATAILTDPLPTRTAYVTNSIQASSGVVTWASDSVHWSGQVVSGTPVVVQFAAEVLTATAGARITNTMELNDGLGNVLTRSVGSIYNPGFGLSINNGALFTNIPTVTLSLSWGLTNPPIEEMFISNDGGFSSGTGWIQVTSIHSGWVLATYGNWVMPRVVFVKFRDSNGIPYGPLQDESIYDPIPPQVTQVQILAATIRTDHAAATQNVIVRVTSNDDNSGVGQIHLSSTADLAQYTAFSTTGSTTEIPWALSSTGVVYVRVVDRAGNLSAISSGESKRWMIYLPVVVR